MLLDLRRLRFDAAPGEPPIRRCRRCQEELAADSHPNARYCGDACRAESRREINRVGQERYRARGGPDKRPASYWRAYRERNRDRIRAYQAAWLRAKKLGKPPK